jgi:YggT family protein
VLDIGGIIAGTIQLVSMLIIVWCLLSWFPNINWYEQPFKTLDQLVRPVVMPFRRIIPPVSGLDLSPMLAIFILQMLGTLARHLIP